MDGEALRAAVASAKTTELAGLGSDALLVALTDGTQTDGAPKTEALLRAAADSEHAAHATFAGWAADEDDDDGAALFAWLAEREGDHRERVLDSLATLGADHDPADGGPMHEYLRARDDLVERVAAGTVGRGLVSDNTHRRIGRFFADEGDASRAALFRALRRETEEELERGVALLEERCGSEDDWERARMVGEYTIQVAYDDYADALRGQGVDVDPPG